MEYAQLNADGSEAIQITTHGNIEWDSNHFCPASALTPDEAIMFRVIPLIETQPPVFNPDTHTCMRDGCEFRNGKWQYHWRVDALSSQAIAQRKADAEALAREAAKAARAATVARIAVEVNGNVFDGDEISQGRMARAIIALDSAGITNTKWILANNVPTIVSAADLRMALVKAGLAQTAVWEV